MTSPRLHSLKLFDLVATFSWGADLNECAAAFASAAALTHLSDGLMFDPQEIELQLLNGAAAIEQARQVIASLYD